ncbi:General transcription factor IIE subunit 1 [Lamellibrachia satsuma]|nr:General transcription factor IIE subunit 1 [Lamellibrachia satsuma]
MNVTEPDVLTEVPETLKRIVRYITRGFYENEAALIIDLLIHHPCIKEDDLIDLLKFERKQLRQAMTILKNDKFINVRMRAETDAEGKMTRHNYYFINYSVLVNVVKFKLDHMRKKIEMEERDSTSRASFLCPRCEKTFTDLEADQLFDFTTQMFRCTYCQEEVKEETISQPKTDARTLMVKFNEQLQPIFSLLVEVEDIKLSAEILNPEPVDLSSKTRSYGSKHPSDRGTWSGEASRNRGYGFTENEVTINIHGDNETVETKQKPPKERPVWLTESTLEAAAASATVLQQTDTFAAPKTTTQPIPQPAMKSVENDDIMKALLAHEKTATTSHVPMGVTVAPPSDEDSSTSESDDETMVTNKPAVTVIGGAVEEMESEEEAVPMVTVGGEHVPYDEVTEEMVGRMTSAEKEEYIRLGQQMYEDMFS